MDIFTHTECLKKRSYAPYIYFPGSRFPWFSNSITAVFPAAKRWFMKRYSRPAMVICETVNICCNDCIICPSARMDRKKEIMPLELFEKVLRDYSAMGGGKLSLTPKVGDIFLDPFLLERLDLIRKFPRITGVSVTTNTIMSDQLPDTHLAAILNSFERIHISVYGIDEEEYTLMTQRETYTRMVKNIRRIIRLTQKKDTLVFGFRFLKKRTRPEIHAWITRNFGEDIPYGETNVYMNWGGSLDSTRPLPFQGKWRAREDGWGQCIIPLAACQIFSNGDVSFCSCNDFDIRQEFCLGNVSTQTITQIFNSKKNAKLWSSAENLPETCKRCVSYRPFSRFGQYEYLLEDPVRLIGG